MIFFCTKDIDVSKFLLFLSLPGVLVLSVRIDVSLEIFRVCCVMSCFGLDFFVGLFAVDVSVQFLGSLVLSVCVDVG